MYPPRRPRHRALAARARPVRDGRHGHAGSASLLVALVSPWFLLLTAFVGVNQWLYVLAGACPASLVLKRVFGLRSVVYPDTEAARSMTTVGPIGQARPLDRRPISAPC